MKRLAELVILALVSVLVPVVARAQWVACADSSVTCTTSPVGIGTTSPTQILHVLVNQDQNTVMTIQNGHAGTAAAGVFRAQSDTAFGSLFAHGSGRTISRYGITLGGWVEMSASLGAGMIVGTLPAVPLILGTNGVERVRVDSAGKVGIGTTAPTEVLDVAGNIRSTGNIHAAGNITASGTINAQYQDIAEWVPANTDLTPGTVVILNQERNNEVMASNGSYDTTVAGVVSLKPGLNLGVAGEGKEAIATTGRVKVRVSAASGAIRIGDLLVTSDIPGTAMRSEPMSINGRKFHQPGTIIGKALEPLAAGQGEILVLLSMQ